MERFKKIYQQGTIDVIEIWVDTETGVNYILSLIHISEPTRPY